MELPQIHTRQATVFPPSHTWYDSLNSTWKLSIAPFLSLRLKSLRYPWNFSTKSLLCPPHLIQSMILPLSCFLLEIYYMIWANAPKSRCNHSLHGSHIRWPILRPGLYASIIARMAAHCYGGSPSSSELGTQTLLQYTLRPITCAVVADDGNSPKIAALPIAMCRARYYLVFPPNSNL